MRITETAIPGLLVLDLDVHGDNRGWFKENWQREKIRALAAEHLLPTEGGDIDSVPRQVIGEHRAGRVG